jgi:hypothetical protein
VARREGHNSAAWGGPPLLLIRWRATWRWDEVTASSRRKLWRRPVESRWRRGVELPDGTSIRRTGGSMDAPAPSPAAARRAHRCGGRAAAAVGGCERRARAPTTHTRVPPLLAGEQNPKEGVTHPWLLVGRGSRRPTRAPPGMNESASPVYLASSGADMKIKEC